MAAMRRKFINQAKKYFGYPYARKYWPPDSLEYKSPLFLDCCGLVRQVMRDLQEDFGFIIGPWNQAYMYDTLPITVQREQDMRPGDLVFISGTYVNPKSKKQRHNMTHVEIWAGEGQKTIGARWNNGKVQYFDSYRFAAKSYYDETYHFKSIDTWLKGICKSHCKDHSWRRKKFKPNKKSIFYVGDDSTQENAQQDQVAGDDDDDTGTQGVLKDIAKMKADIKKGLARKAKGKSEAEVVEDVDEDQEENDDIEDDEEYAQDDEDEMAEAATDDSDVEDETEASVEVRDGRLSSAGNLVDLCNRGLYLQDLVSAKGTEESSLSDASDQNEETNERPKLKESICGDIANLTLEKGDSSAITVDNLQGEEGANNEVNEKDTNEDNIADDLKGVDASEVDTSNALNANKNALPHASGNPEKNCGVNPTSPNSEPIKLGDTESVTDCVSESFSEDNLAQEGTPTAGSIGEASENGI